MSKSTHDFWLWNNDLSGNVILSKVCGWKWQKYSKKTECNVELLIVAQHMIFGSDVLDYSINLYIVLIKYGQQPCVINILKRTYEAEIQSASFYQTPAIRESIVKNCNILR